MNEKEVQAQLGLGTLPIEIVRLPVTGFMDYIGKKGWTIKIEEYAIGTKDGLTEFKFSASINTENQRQSKIVSYSGGTATLALKNLMSHISSSTISVMGRSWGDGEIHFKIPKLKWDLGDAPL